MKNTTPDTVCDRHSLPHQECACVGNKCTSSMHAPPPNRSRLEALEQQLCHQQLAAQLQCAQWVQHGEAMFGMSPWRSYLKKPNIEDARGWDVKFVYNKGTPSSYRESVSNVNLWARQGRVPCKKQKVVESGVFCVWKATAQNYAVSIC